MLERFAAPAERVQDLPHLIVHIRHLRIDAQGRLELRHRRNELPIVRQYNCQLDVRRRGLGLLAHGGLEMSDRFAPALLRGVGVAKIGMDRG